MEQRLRQTLSDFFDPQVAEHARLENLGGHASLRIYWRVHLPSDLQPPRVYPRGELTQMAMVLPEGADQMASDEGGSSADARPTELPFVDVQRYLANIGLPVPAIDRVDMARGVLLLEDLGDEMFEHAVLAASGPDDVEDLYRQAIELLVDLQMRVEAERAEPRYQSVAFGRAFDAELLRWELDHYREWGLDNHYGPDALGEHREALNALFDRLTDEICALPTTLVLRDYQSRNIMRKQGTWVLIDFQDALIGPVIYDLVALLRDSYIELQPDQVARLLEVYIDHGARRGLPWCADAETLRRAFYLQTLQRKLKDAGRFIFIDKVKHNPGFLDYYQPSIGYVRQALHALDGYHGLDAILAAVEPAYGEPSTAP
ncbi:aminoglycoside phosphotransferase [Lujinxingia litoralis]|uniref:Aminoglycoside phosphotransferase n=1 Tax=Lujinxingia litoralis TaxID=2211119 RepID=A0A328C4T2_9DELT|nr:phosphotransferase [Lujinxingia litoralis]RAL20030.1 aminoglycoside phosphotransferase [Lujinxingia litoralis]